MKREIKVKAQDKARDENSNSIETYKLTLAKEMAQGH
jgi:hypothetical protein